MNNNMNQSFAKAINYKNSSANVNKKMAPEKSPERKPDNKVISEMVELRKPIPRIPQESTLSVSAERLQEAIIWSEILDKPLSKRRKRR